MISRYKAWCISLFAMLSMMVGSHAVFGATTYSVDVNGAHFIPSTVTALVGDTLVLNFKDDYHQVYYNGSLIFGRIQFKGETYSQTFTADGTYTYYDARYDSTLTVTVTQPQNAAPTVALVTPTNHTAIMVTNSVTNITLRADAQDEDGSVRRVQFYFGSYTDSFAMTNLIGTITNSSTNNTAFNYTWTNVAPGRYQVQARAYDNLEVYANSIRANLSLYTPFTNTLPYITNSTSVAFRFNTDTGLVYVIEVSTNLTNWASISTNTATNSFIEVVDPNLTTLTQRMYRIRLLP